MRQPLYLALLAGMLAPGLGAAQQTSLQPGDTVRVRLTQQPSWQHGTVERVEAGLLVLHRTDGSMHVRVADIERLELRHPGSFNGGGALVWGGIAAAAGVAGGLLAGGTDAGDLTTPALYFGLYGAALGGGGARARRSMGYGALIGTAPGALLGLAMAEGECSPHDFLCVSPGAWAASGAVMGAAAGAMIGAWVGALGRKPAWQKVPVHGLAVAPRADGRLAVMLTHHR